MEAHGSGSVSDSGLVTTGKGVGLSASSPGIAGEPSRNHTSVISTYDFPSGTFELLGLGVPKSNTNSDTEASSTSQEEYRPEEPNLNE